MRQSIPFVSPSYNRSDFYSVSSQSCVNFYLENYPTASPRATVAAIGMPGLSTYINLVGSSVRGMISYQGTGYVVVDNGVYQITNASTVPPTATLLGTIATSTGPVNFCAIGLVQQIVLNDGVNTYYIHGGTPPGTLTNITNAGGIPASVLQAVAKDGFFLYLQATNNTVWVSNIQDAATVGGAFFQLSSHFDQLQWAVALDQYVYFFGQNVSEIWYNAGTALQPFGRTSGGVLQFGVVAGATAVNVGDSLYLLGQLEDGILGVVTITGSSYSVISDPTLNTKITGYVKTSDAFAWKDSVNGHQFYNITFPTAEQILSVGGVTANRGRTWSYDVTQGNWSERTSWNPSLNLQDRHLCNCSMFLGGMQIIGDYQSGYLYVESTNNLSDTIQGVNYPIYGTLIGPHLMDHGNNFSVYNLEFEIERGEGLDGTGQGSAPQVAFSYSKDQGHTYTGPFMLNLPHIGNYKKRVRKGSVGGARVLTMKLDFTDPIKRVVTGITAEIEYEGRPSNSQLSFMSNQ